jgi:hypothetical protein
VREKTGNKIMFVTFETIESKQITIDITGVSGWDNEQLTRYACEQLNTDYTDYQDRRSRKLKKGAVVTPINWRPLKVSCRQKMLTIKRPPRKYSVVF